MAPSRRNHKVYFKLVARTCRGVGVIPAAAGGGGPLSATKWHLPVSRCSAAPPCPAASRMHSTVTALNLPGLGPGPRGPGRAGCAQP
jgi:hypothetical protein